MQRWVIPIQQRFQVKRNDVIGHNGFGDDVQNAMPYLKGAAGELTLDMLRQMYYKLSVSGEPTFVDIQNFGLRKSTGKYIIPLVAEIHTLDHEKAHNIGE